MDKAMMNNMQRRAAEYDDLVHQYHALDAEIDQLMEENEGHSDNMSAEARAKYKELARRRDDVFNAMRALEQELFSDES